MPMSKLVSSVGQVIANIRTYNASVTKLAELMPYARAWYAVRNGNDWLLGPSKFIGYEDASAEAYLGSPYSTEKRGRITRDKQALPLDGRVTEGVLSRWSEAVEEGHPEYESLHTALNRLCAHHGKKPNTLARIAILQAGTETSAPTYNDKLVDLLVTVFHGLTPAQKSAFRRHAAL